MASGARHRSDAGALSLSSWAVTSVSVGMRSRYRGEVPGESFFLAFGAIGLSLAGFAGLIAALERNPADRSAVSAYRIRNIVFLGFGLSIAGLGTIAAYSATGSDLPLTIRTGTILLVLLFLRGLVFETRPGPAWPSERERLTSMGVVIAMLLVTLGNLVVANLGYLELLMLLGLLGPISIFYNTIRAATTPDVGDD